MAFFCPQKLLTIKPSFHYSSIHLEIRHLGAAQRIGCICCLFKYSVLFTLLTFLGWTNNLNWIISTFQALFLLSLEMQPFECTNALRWYIGPTRLPEALSDMTGIRWNTHIISMMRNKFACTVPSQIAYLVHIILLPCIIAFHVDPTVLVENISEFVPWLSLLSWRMVDGPFVEVNDFVQ